MNKSEYIVFVKRINKSLVDDQKCLDRVDQKIFYVRKRIEELPIISRLPMLSSLFAKREDRSFLRMYKRKLMQFNVDKEAIEARIESGYAKKALLKDIDESHFPD